MEVVLSDDNFESEVLQSDVDVLVDFWASWCGPCKMLAPTIEQIADEYGAKLKVCKLDIDQCRKTAEKYGIMSIPTVVVFKNGKESARSVGLVPKDKIIALL